MLNYYEEALGLLNNIKDLDFYIKQIKTRFAPIYKKILGGEDIVVCGYSPYARDIMQSLQNKYKCSVSVVEIIKKDNIYYDSSYYTDIGVPIQFEDIHSSYHYKKGPVYIIASSVYLGDFYQKLRGANIEDVIPYHGLTFMDSSLDGSKYTYRQDVFIKAIENIIDSHYDYIKLLSWMYDEPSKNFLARMIIYRLTASLPCLDNGGSCEQDFYFRQPFLPYDANNEVFMDVGGYCGDTLESFLRCYHNNFKQYYFFEPESDLIEKAKKLTTNKKIIFYNIGLYNEKGILQFSASGKGIGAIDSQGKNSIPVDTIDNIVTEPPTYIKIVVEGAEIEVLEGAENTIKNQTPIIAISCYHKPEHILDISKYLKTLNPYYKFYIRSGFNSIYNYVTLFALN